MFVLRDDAQEIQLAEINYFIECVVVNASGVGDGSEDRSKVIMVAVSFFILPSLQSVVWVANRSLVRYDFFTTNICSFAKYNISSNIFT